MATTVSSDLSQLIASIRNDLASMIERLEAVEAAETTRVRESGYVYWTPWFETAGLRHSLNEARLRAVIVLERAEEGP